MSSSKRKRVSEVSGGGDSESGECGAGVEAVEVGRLVDCSQADDRRLIGLVRKRQLLYARNNMPVASYYSQVKKLWQQVADAMGWSVADVRRKWSHIRNSYSRHLRNEMYGLRTGRGRMVSKWYLADELAFLREHMATDSKQTQRKYDVFYVPAATCKSEKPYSPGTPAPELKPFISNPWFAQSVPPAAEPHRTLAVEPQPRDDSSSVYSFDAEENSAYFQFFRGIHNDYQELSASKKRLFRRECLAFLHRLLDAEAPRAQSDALDLSNSVDTDDERDSKMFVIEKMYTDTSATVTASGDNDYEDDDSSNHVLPH